MDIKKEESKLSRAGFFSNQDFENCKRVAELLFQSGNVVMLVAPKKELISYYSNLVTSMLVREVSKRGSLNTLQLPKNKESILKAINDRLNPKTWDVVCESRLLHSEEIWIAENLNKGTVLEVIFAGRMTRKVPGSGISLLVFADLENSRGVREVMHSLKVERFDFPLPDAQQISHAVAKASSLGDKMQIVDLAKSIGIKAPSLNKVSNENPGSDPVALMEKVKDSFISDQDVRELIRNDKKRRSDARRINLSGKANFLSNLAAFIRPKTMRASLSLIAGFSAVIFLFSGFHQSSTEDMRNLSSVSNQRALNDKQNSIQQRETADARSNQQELKRLKDFSSGQKVQFDTDAGDAEDDLMLLFNKDDFLVSDFTEDPEPATIDSTETTSDESLEEKQPPKEVDSKAGGLAKAEYYVQHAAFRNLEGAMIWKAESLGRQSFGVFTKGVNPQTFVVLSGPFEDKVDALRAIDKSSDAFLVKSFLIGSPVLSVSGL